jgi:hypothetical protein
LNIFTKLDTVGFSNLCYEISTLIEIRVELWVLTEGRGGMVLTVRDTEGRGGHDTDSERYRGERGHG